MAELLLFENTVGAKGDNAAQRRMKFYFPCSLIYLSLVIIPGGSAATTGWPAVNTIVRQIPAASPGWFCFYRTPAYLKALFRSLPEYSRIHSFRLNFVFLFKITGHPLTKIRADFSKQLRERF